MLVLVVDEDCDISREVEFISRPFSEFSDHLEALPFEVFYEIVSQTEDIEMILNISRRPIVTEKN
jgi:hypothetical protein